MYVSQPFSTVFLFVHHVMASSKTLLNTYCQERHLQLPVYSTQRAKGAGYDSSVQVSGRQYYSQAVHSSTNLAEEDAARVAYNNLRQASRSTSGRTSTGSALKSRSAGHDVGAYGYEDASPSSISSAFASTKRAGLAAQPIATNANAYVDYSQKLEKLCNARGLPAPEYDVAEEPSDGKFVATIVIGNDEYWSGNSESRAQAKNYAALIALAEVGLSLLNINEREDGKHCNTIYTQYI